MASGKLFYNVLNKDSFEKRVSQGDIPFSAIAFLPASREIWKDQVETLILSEKMGELLEQTKKTYPMTVDYKQIVLGKADLAAETK